MKITEKSKNIIDVNYMKLMEKNFPRNDHRKNVPALLHNYVLRFFDSNSSNHAYISGYNFARSAEKWEEGGRDLPQDQTAYSGRRETYTLYQDPITFPSDIACKVPTMMMMTTTSTRTKDFYSTARLRACVIG